MMEGTPARLDMFISTMRFSQESVAYSSRWTAAPMPSGTEMSAGSPTRHNDPHRARSHAAGSRDTLEAPSRGRGEAGGLREYRGREAGEELPAQQWNPVDGDVHQENDQHDQPDHGGRDHKPRHGGDQ